MSTSNSSRISQIDRLIVGCNDYNRPRYPNWLKFRDDSKARAQYALAESLEKAARKYLAKIDKDFGMNLSGLAGSEYEPVFKAGEWRDSSRPQKRAYVRLNADYLRAVIGSVRERTMMSGGITDSFDKQVYERDAVWLLIESALKHWERTGGETLIEQAATKLQASCPFEVKLMAKEEALTHALDELELRVGVYVGLKHQEKQAREAALRLAPAGE